MVCWLFVGSATFASIFAYLGGNELIKEFVLGMNLNAVTFLLLSQVIIFLLGWPLEWTEIIIIFVPIFLPMLSHFGIDPILFGVLVALNLQTAFLSPPMAMSAYYLKGVSPPSVLLTQIFSGCMPFVYVVLVTMLIDLRLPRHRAVAAQRPVRPLSAWTAQLELAVAPATRRRRIARRRVQLPSSWSQACLARIRADRARRCRPGSTSTRRTRWRRRARATPTAREGRADRPAARRAGRHQGHHRHRRHAHRGRHRAARRAARPTATPPWWRCCAPPAR